MHNRARIIVQVTIYRRLRIGRDGYLDQSEACDISYIVREYGRSIFDTGSRYVQCIFMIYQMSSNMIGLFHDNLGHRVIFFNSFIATMIHVIILGCITSANGGYVFGRDGLFAVCTFSRIT